MKAPTTNGTEETFHGPTSCSEVSIENSDTRHDGAAAGGDTTACTPEAGDPEGLNNDNSKNAQTSCDSQHPVNVYGVSRPSRLQRMSTPGTKLADLHVPDGCADATEDDNLMQPELHDTSATAVPVVEILCPAPSSAATTSNNYLLQQVQQECSLIHQPIQTMLLIHARNGSQRKSTSSSCSSSGIDIGSTTNKEDAASAVSLKLSWPPGWCWPQKLLHAAGSGVQHVRVRRSGLPGEQQQHNAMRPSELLTAIHECLMRSHAVMVALKALALVATEAADTQSSAASSSSSSAAAGAPAALSDAMQLVQAAVQQQFYTEFAGWDADGDGVLSTLELEGMLQQVLPPGSVGREEAQYFQVVLDRSGAGCVSAADILAAVHVAVALGVGICPKTQVDIHDVLLHLVVQLVVQQQQQQHGPSSNSSSGMQADNAAAGFLTLVQQHFNYFDSSGHKKLSCNDLTRLCRSVLPALSNKEVRYILGHMSELDHGSGEVSLKSFIKAVQPIQQALHALTHHQHACTLQQWAASLGEAAVQDAMGERHVAGNDMSLMQLPAALAPLRISQKPPGASSSSRKSITTIQHLVEQQWGVVAVTDAAAAASAVSPVTWPMQELSTMLVSSPAALHLAFMQTAAAAAAAATAAVRSSNSNRGSVSSNRASSSISSSRESSSGGSAIHQCLPLEQQQRYSLVPITALSYLLAKALPSWGGADISYAALQIRCHMNIIANFSLDSPVAAAHSTTTIAADSKANQGSSSDNPVIEAASLVLLECPKDLMYAELAATIVSAASTESAVAAKQLPQAAEQLLVDLTDELMSNPAVQQRVAAAWDAAAARRVSGGGAAAAAATAASSVPNQAGIAAASGDAAASVPGCAATKLPVVAAVKLLCRELLGVQGLSDIRLLGWITCLVRKQHIDMQLSALNRQQTGAHKGHSSDMIAVAAAGGLSAELPLSEFVEVLQRLVQGLLTPEDAVLLQEYMHVHQQQQMHEAQQVTLPSTTDRDDPPGSTPRSWGYSSSQYDGVAAAADEPVHVSSRPRRECIMLDDSSPSSPICHGYGYASAGGASGPGNSSVSRSSSCTGSAAGPPCGHSSAGSRSRPLMPQELQQQREQLNRLKAAQQQAWLAEIAMSHDQPWEGAYSPVASSAGGHWELTRASSGGGGGPAVNILRLSSSGWSSRTCSNGCS